jgi:DNA-directed RNA polymerase specialized sigma24 family protein
MGARCTVASPDLDERRADPAAGPTPRLLDALTALSPEQQRVLAECCFRGASVAQAAATLHLSQPTVRAQIHRALHSLRAAVGEGAGSR